MGEPAERVIVVTPSGCPACGDDLLLHTRHPQPGEPWPEADDETVPDEWRWAAYEGDDVTCAGCDHRGVVRLDGDDAIVCDEPACDCEWCGG